MLRLQNISYSKQGSDEWLLIHIANTIVCNDYCFIGREPHIHTRPWNKKLC